MYAKIVADLMKEGLLDSEMNPTEVPPALQSAVSCPLQCPPQTSLEVLEISPLKGVAEWPKEIILNHITMTSGNEDREGESVAQWMKFGCLKCAHIACRASRLRFAVRAWRGRTSGKN